MKKRGNGKKLAISILLFFVINAFTSYVWMSPHSINPTSVRKDNSNKNIYWMIDCLRGEEEQAYFSSDVAIVLEQYIRKLEQDDVYQYCIFGKQKIWTDMQGIKREINTYQVNQVLLSLFPFEITKGRSFGEQDFAYKRGNNIPVVVGHDLGDEFKVGDVFESIYMREQLQFEVVGILAEGFLVPLNDLSNSLDEDIIMPSFWVQEPKEDISFMRKALDLHYASGYFVVSSDKCFSDLLEHIDDLRELYGVFEIQFAQIERLTISWLRFLKMPFIHMLRGIWLIIWVWAAWNMSIAHATINRNKPKIFIIGSVMMSYLICWMLQGCLYYKIFSGEFLNVNICGMLFYLGSAYAIISLIAIERAKNKGEKRCVSV